MSDTFIITTNLLATRWQRFANYVIDSFVKYIINLALSALAGYIYDEFYSANILMFLANKSNRWQNLLVTYVISVLYYFIFEAITHRTLGKYITGTIVITEDGSKLTVGNCLTRTLCRMIPLEAFSFFRESSRGWHDTITNTVVVKAKKYNEALNLKNSFNEIGALQDS